MNRGLKHESRVVTVILDRAEGANMLCKQLGYAGGAFYKAPGGDGAVRPPDS